MQQNEFLMCMTDMGIVPSMITKRRALHIFHMVTTGANSPDSVNFDLFRSVVLIVSCFKAKESVHRVYGKHCSYRHSDFY